jgi:MFS family permease
LNGLAATKRLITWGVAAAMTGLVRNVHQICVMRFLLGLAEAGYVHGILLYLTYWFPKNEQARAIALFLTGLPATTIVGAPLSGLIAHSFLQVSSCRSRTTKLLTIPVSV